MSIVTVAPNSDRPAMPGITRRMLLCGPMVLGTTRRPEAPALPGGAIRAGDDDSEYLEALLDQLRRTWPVEARDRKSLGRIEYKTAGWEEAFKRSCESGRRRNGAGGDLMHAVLEVAGTVKPDEDTWERFGLPLAIVSTGAHLLVVSATDQAEYHEEPDDWGMLELVILDL